MKTFFIKSLFLVLAVLLTSLSFSQGRYGRGGKPEKLSKFVQPFDYAGWYFSPGITLTPKMNFLKYDPTLTTSTFQPDVYTAINLKQQSKVGAYFEVGRYRFVSFSDPRISEGRIETENSTLFGD